jgi:UDP-glucose 4-epimerase
MSILITGGAGYIGSHTCVALMNTGEDVVLLDNFSNSKPEIVRNIKKLTDRDFPVYSADLTHYEAIRRVFEREKIEAVIHFAGLKAVGESVRIPLEYYHNNITGTVNLLRVMAEFGCKKMVFSSSATVYGDKNPIPYVEGMPLSSTSPYGSTKVVIEGILRELHTADPEWHISLLRYFNPIGAHESGLLGEDPNGIPNNLLPYICRVSVGSLPKLHVFGGDYPTPDGTCKRDYLHVCDLADGHISALNYIRTHDGVDEINLGRGEGYSVLEIIAAYEKAGGIKIPYEIVGRRAGDIAEFYANPTKAEKLLNWKAKRDIDEMCRDSWNFIRKTVDDNG